MIRQWEFGRQNTLLANGPSNQLPKANNLFALLLICTSIRHSIYLHYSIRTTISRPYFQFTSNFYFQFLLPISTSNFYFQFLLPVLTSNFWPAPFFEDTKWGIVGKSTVCRGTARARPHSMGSGLAAFR
jgi:hypothetical protein